MSRRAFLWGAFWSLLGLAVVFHLAAGWYFSGVLIEDGFTPRGEAFLIPIGDYQLEEVRYDTPLGEMDALYLPATGSTWVIHVHGKGKTPVEAEPLFTELQMAGYPQLAITYRNDEGAPRDPSGLYQYGMTEWEDVNGAVEYALGNGADKIVLSGFSSGAAHIMSFMLNRSLDPISGVLMDSPNIDFGAAVDYEASQRELPLIPVRVPPTVTEVAKFIASLRHEINWISLDYVGKADLIIKQPVLIHHGTDDSTVPIAVSIALAEARPDMVRLIPVQGAGHVESYLVEPEQYTSDVLAFLSTLG